MKKKELNWFIQKEIQRLSEKHDISSEVLNSFAFYVIENRTKKRFTLGELKQFIYQYFEVENTQQLKKSKKFKLAVSDMGNLRLNLKKSWEIMYRKFIGILPHERNEVGADCINGINIFKYFKPWDVFDLDPQTATPEEIKSAYHELSKVYHPDNQKTGNRQVFERINVMYRSLSEM